MTLSSEDGRRATRCLPSCRWQLRSRQVPARLDANPVDGEAFDLLLHRGEPFGDARRAEQLGERS
jgi:hypothetical protein